MSDPNTEDLTQECQMPTANDQGQDSSKPNEPIIREADVQEIINMMKDDLDQVKLNSKNDQASLNGIESPKSSRNFNETENYISTSVSNNSENGNEESNAQKTEEATEPEDTISKCLIKSQVEHLEFTIFLSLCIVRAK